MQGQPVLANIVRTTGAALRGQAELSLARYGDGRTAPSLRASLSRDRGAARDEAAISLYRSVDDEKGKGPRVRTNADGTLRERAIYDERDGFRGGTASFSHEQPLWRGRLQLNASARRERERADTDLTFLVPLSGLQHVIELETKDNFELGAGWSGTIGPALSLEFTAVQRFTRDDATEHSDEAGATEDVAERGRGGESVARVLLRLQASPAWTLEGGAEGAYNFLDSRAALAADGVPIPLPAANVRVSERRGELFGAAIWRASARFSAEAGLRFEASRLVQTGDSSLTKSLAFPKPRLVLTWSPARETQWRARIERTVSQLDFGDFVSSTSLTSSTITAGNADLEPQRVWTASLAWERRFAGNGALVLTARHEWISHTLDRVGVIGPGYAFDAPGNVGAGGKTKIEADLSLPLDRIGIAGGLLKVDLGYRWTHVIDPTTGQARRISGEEPIDGEIHFTQDRPALGVRWGLDYVVAKDEREYRFDEIRRTRIAGRLSAFVECRPAAAWTVRAFAENLTGRPVERDRAIFAGARADRPLRYVEVRRLATRPLVGLLVRRDFGK